MTFSDGLNVLVFIKLACTHSYMLRNKCAHPCKPGAKREMCFPYVGLIKCSVKCVNLTCLQAVVS